MKTNSMETKLGYFLNNGHASICSIFRKIERKYVRKVDIQPLKHSCLH